MARLVDLVQGTPEWHAWRLEGLGGSDVASVLGISPYADATRDDLLREKVTGVGKDLSYAMRRGQLLEPEARWQYQQRAGAVRVRACCAEHDEHSWARASLDGVVTPWDDGEPWLLELKCPRWETHELLLAGVVPDYIAAQVQWQLFVTGLRWCDVASFNPGRRFAEADRLAVVPVEADPGLQGRLLEEAAAFWLEVLAAREGVAA